MRTAMQELAWAGRRLLRNPMSAPGIVLTLMLGIAVSVSMFSVLQGVVLSSLPYPDAERIVHIVSGNPEQGVPLAQLTPAEAVEGLAEAPGFEYTAYYNNTVYTFIGGDTARNITRLGVSTDYFPVFGVQAALGRTLTAADAAEGRAVAVLNHAAWVELTGGDPDAVGETLAFQEGSFELVGVLPESFVHPRSLAPIVYRPAEVPADGTPAYLHSRSLQALGRLSPGVSPALADRGLQVRLEAVNEAYSLPDSGWRLRQITLLDEWVGDIRSVLFALFAVALLVLLIACATAASLVWIRLEQRGAELAMRRALGAGHMRVAADAMLELLLLAAPVAVGGVLLAHWAIGVLQPLAIGSLPRAANMGIDGATLLFAVAATAASMLLSGMVPLLRALRGDPARVLRGGTDREVAGGRRIAWLPVAGVGLSTAALIVALALAASLIRLGNVDPGFRTEGIAALQLVRLPPHGAIPMERVFQELRAIPGVSLVAAASTLGTPTTLSATDSVNVTVQGAVSAQPHRIRSQAATAGYHDLLGIPILRGRGISEEDVSGGPLIGVINESLAQQVFPDTDPIGQVLLVSWGGEPTPFEVVGIAANTRNAGLRAPAEPILLFSAHQAPLAMTATVTLLVDAPVQPPNWLHTLEEAIGRADPNQPVYRAFILAEELDAQIRGLRFFANATGWFSLLVLLLGAVGIHAVVAAKQRQRQREIALRLALGAAPRQAAALVLGGAARIVGLGIAAGAVLTLPALPWLQDQVFGIEGGAFLGLFGLTALVLAVAGLAAAGWPAWRASRVAPMEALRHE